MEYSETEKQMLREILPGIATQLRGSLANIHAALGRLAPEQARDASTDTDRSAAILCQSYYRILRVVNNLSDAPMLAEEKPLDTENVELVRFLDGLCRQGEALAQLMELRLTFTCPERAHTVAVNREYLARLFWNLVSNAMKFTPRGGTVDVCLRSGQGCVLLSVKDSGSGIPQDKQAQLFDRWQHSHMDLPAHGLGLGLPLWGDLGLNLFNSESLLFWKELGLEAAAVSMELRWQQLRDLRKVLPCEAVVYGRLPLMIMENCVIRNELGCRDAGRDYADRSPACRCGQENVLVDRTGAQFPLVGQWGHRCEIENSQVLFLADKPEWRQLGLTRARLRFTTESPEECARVLRAYQGRSDYRPDQLTRGLFYRGVE